MNRLRVIRELLTDGQNEFQRRLSRLLVDRAVSEYQVWRRTTGEAGGLRDALRPIYGFKTDRTGREPLPAELALAIDLHEFLVQSLQQTLDQQTEWREAFAVFQRIFTRAPSESERRRLILEFAARLGATPRQLKQDNRAFDRFFGFDTIVERFHRIYGESEQWTEFLLTWLGRLSARLLGAAPSPESRRAVWQQLEWNTIYETSTASTHNFRVTVALHEALLGAIRSLSCKPAIPFDWHAVRLCEGRGEAGEERVGKGDGERVGNRSIAERRDPPRPSTTQGVPPTCSLGDTERGHVLEDSILQSIRRVSLDRTQNVWVQAAALSLLAEQSPLDFRRTAENRLTKPDGGDDVFVRRRAVELLAEHGQHLSNWQDLVIGAAQDTSRRRR